MNQIEVIKTFMLFVGAVLGAILMFFTVVFTGVYIFEWLNLIPFPIEITNLQKDCFNVFSTNEM